MNVPVVPVIMVDLVQTMLTDTHVLVLWDILMHNVKQVPNENSKESYS